MAWTDSDRASRLPSNWASELVPAVKKRDKGRCTWQLPSFKRCPRPGTEVDHVRPGDDHRMSNLRLLCEHHHAKKSSREGLQARKKITSSRYRPAEGHPGRLR